MLRLSSHFFRIAFAKNKSCLKYLIMTIILELIVIGLLYNLNSQYGYLYQGIQDYNKTLIWRSIGIFSGIAGILVIAAGYTTYFSNKLAFALRTGLTNHYTDKLEEYKEIQNIDQRIQEDLRNFGKFSVEFWLSVFKATIKLPLFLSVIITLTSWWVGLIILSVVVIGTGLTKVLSNKLIQLQITQETNEANFRQAIKRKTNIFGHWMKIDIVFYLINKQVKKLNFLQSGLGQTFVLLPFIILIPLYIAKTITMGAFFQSVNALGKVIDSLTILIDQRQLIADISTCLKRMETLK